MKKRWEYSKETKGHYLIFTPYDDEITVSLLYMDEDGDWIVSSKVTNACQVYLGSGEDMSLEEAKIDVEDMVWNHYMDQANYYQELANIFHGEEKDEPI